VWIPTTTAGSGTGTPVDNGAGAVVTTAEAVAARSIGQDGGGGGHSPTVRRGEELHHEVAELVAHLRLDGGEVEEGRRQFLVRQG
jgi:hypothetical protein